MHRANDGVGALVCVSRSKTDQEGASADTRYLKDGAARAVWELRPAGPPAGARVLGGLNGASVARRFGAAARAAGVVGRITGHSGRIGLASELTRRGATTTETMLAGGWKTARMVAHYSDLVSLRQWPYAEFLPIALQFDMLFERVGWLKRT